MAHRDEVLYLIDHVGIFAGRERKLMDLDKGAPYKYMLKEFFPALRRVEITVNYDLHRIIEEKLHRKLTKEEFEAELAKERAEAEAEERRLAELARMEESAVPRRKPVWRLSAVPRRKLVWKPSVRLNRPPSCSARRSAK